MTQQATKTMGYDDRDALYGRLRDHFLRIGDTQFYVPPTAIQVTKRMKNERSYLLRGRGSITRNSGYFDQIIEVSLFFPDAQSINNELRPLLAQSKKCPFLPIENTLLNNAYGIDAITIAGVTVSTVQGFPHALQAQLQLYVFNPYAYIYDSTERTYDEMFNWPMFRWHYRRSLEPNDQNRTYFEPLRYELDDSYMFRIAAQDDLDARRQWRLDRDRLIKQWNKDKVDKPGIDLEDIFGDQERTDFQNELKNKYNAPLSKSVSDEDDEDAFNAQLDALYNDPIYKESILAHKFFMEEWPIPNLVLEDISVSFENYVTSVQLQAHESPTHQFMGSQDTMVICKFKTNDAESLSSLDKLIRRNTYLTREYHKELPNGYLEFDHQLTRLFGVRYVVVEDMVSATVEGQPGVFDITLTLTSYNRAQRKLMETDWLIGRDKDTPPAHDTSGDLLNFNVLNPPLQALNFLQSRPWWKEFWGEGYLAQDLKKRVLYENKVADAFKAMEVYPDLELPLYVEVEAAGFQIPNLNNGYFVDPDFFLIYDDPIDFGADLSKHAAMSYSSEMRDAMGGKATVSGTVITPGETVKTQIEEIKKSGTQVQDQPAGERQYTNYTKEQMEILIRQKAAQQTVGDKKTLDPAFAIALIRAFDEKMRQFYEAGPGANKELDNVYVKDQGVPVLQTKDMKYFADDDLIRESSFIGVMRVNPILADSRSLAYNIDYNVEQGLANLKYYYQKAIVSDFVYQAFGLDDNRQQDVEKAKWISAVCNYLGFEREYRNLQLSNKKMPNTLTLFIKKFLGIKDKIVLMSEAEYKEKVQKLPKPDYKTINLNSATPSFKEEPVHEEALYEDDAFTMREMFHDAIKYDRRGRLVRAFPTFFLTFVDEGQFIGAIKLSDQYFGYRAVTDISYTNSRKSAASTLVLDLCNVYGSLDDAMKSQDLTHTSMMELLQYMFAPGALANDIERSRNRTSNWYKSLYLRTGARVHFRMGYGSNPMNMPVTMNGAITSIQNNGETLSVIVQSDGIELTNKINAKPDDTTSGFIFSQKEPTEILTELLTDNRGWWSEIVAAWDNAEYAKHSLGIMHFGAPGLPANQNEFWQIFGASPADRDHEIMQNIYQTTGLRHTEQDSWLTTLGDFFGIGSGDEEGINMNLYDKTVWDVLNITAAMGPDMIVAVHPFDFRNTIFHGKPYFPMAYGYQIEGEEGAEQIKQKIKPFRQIHIHDSWTSIIDNSIKATEENMYTVAIGTYMNEGKLDTTEPVYVDTDIWPEKQKTVNIDTQLNAQGIRLLENIPVVGEWLNKPFKWYFDEGAAIRITAAGLRDFVKEMYDGYLTTMGDPAVKPYDQVILNDTHNDIKGPIEVREVNHIMNLETGFITMINPDAVVVNGDKKTFSILTNSFAVAMPVMVSALLRNQLKNKGYGGVMPIMNAVWASSKSNFKNMKYKFMDSKAMVTLRDMVNMDEDKYQKNRQLAAAAAEVRWTDKPAPETVRRWRKNGLLSEISKYYQELDDNQLQELLDKGNDKLYNKRFLGYHNLDQQKMLKLTQKASSVMAGSKISRGVVAGARGAWMAAHVMAGPLGILAAVIETLVIGLITAGISEFIERFLFTRQACIISPLYKDGVEWTAGINGHKGSVVTDSPDTWQWILTNTASSILLSTLIGADTSKYQQPDADDPFSTMAEEDSPPIDMNQLAKDFFARHRKVVSYDGNLKADYDRDVQRAKESREARAKELEEENARHAEYPEEDRPDLKEWFDHVMGSIQEAVFGQEMNEGDFISSDLNKPSGISAEAIDKAFDGTPLAGLGRAFKQVEYSMPNPISISANDEGSGNNGSRVMNGLYLAAHAAWETGWGKSRIYQDKNNLFGYGAYDHSPYESAYSFPSPEACVYYAADRIKTNYLTQGGKFYNQKYGPTLTGMNEKYASDPNWKNGIASIMKKIAQYDPNFLANSSAGKANVTGEVPTIYGKTGKNKYHINSESQAQNILIDLRKQPLQNVRLTIVTNSSLVRKSSYEAVEALGRAYKQKTGETLAITSTYRPGDPAWHGTGFAIDVDTPNCDYIFGQMRFPKGSKEKRNLEILMDLALQIGFDGVIHGDVDVVAKLKQKYPDRLVLQQDDHFNHLHLSYVRK